VRRHPIPVCATIDTWCAVADGEPFREGLDPVAVAGIVDRPRLYDVLDSPLVRMCVVQGPTGSGKTTLVRSWVLRRPRPGATVWVPLGPGEHDHQAAWETLGDARVQVTRDLPLATVALALERCALVLANDSALAHLGAAADVATVVVFGPTDPALTHPLGSRWSAIVASGSCSLQPCFPHFGERFDPRRCPHGFTCLRSIGVDDAVRALERRILSAGGELAARPRSRTERVHRPADTGPVALAPPSQT